MSKKIFIVYIVVAILMLQYQNSMVNAGRSKKSMMIGVALGAAIARSQQHDLRLLHVLIPLRLAAEAWKQMGKNTNHHHHHDYDYDGHHHHHGGGGYYRRRRR
ncbi:uncharacterized protein LOC113789490 [Dermatophagoides pteronyssinus]|uniref:uncharacterized protein LOC113789490 n=1 Tax=Dermatophagoides pteronyssinus TaxID=6956 RepID=UPI003F67182F